MTAPDNSQRAEWAQIAAMSFARQTGQDWKAESEQVLSNLLNNIVHLCDRDNVSFRDVYVNAVLQYQRDVDMPMPFAIKDMGDENMTVLPGQGLTVERLPNETAAWLRLQDLPGADTGRFYIEDVRK
jgi:hypothetical protein